MGFLDYARSLLFEKDEAKIKLVTSYESRFPQFSGDESGFVMILPEPKVEEDKDGEETISVMGYLFPADSQGKRQLATLFRAAIFHLSAHTISSRFEDYEEWRKGKDPRIVKFTTSLIEDVMANSVISERYSDKLVDLGFANTLALKKLNPIDRLMNPATKIMAGLLVKVHTGLMKVESEKERNTIVRLARRLDKFGEKVSGSMKDTTTSLKDERLKVAEEIYSSIEGSGPIVEVPSFPHTEELGRCSIFSPSFFVNFDVINEDDFKTCLSFLRESPSFFEERESVWRKMAEAEGMQVFDSWKARMKKNKEIIDRYEKLLDFSRLTDVQIPAQSYSKFLKIKSGCRSEAHRLIESLLVARDAIDEDPRKMYGVLDLQEAIQVIASKSPRMDVFMLDENISKSYAWVILLDASRSMEVIRDFALELFVMLGEAANQLLLDPASWGMYAFNNKLLVIKDPKERYNVRVKSRIGGIRFEGFTFLPDALKVAGEIVKERNENLRLITVVSDGWPYGYSEVENMLSETLVSFGNQNIAVIGIGAKSQRMDLYFNNSFSVYSLRDLKNRFSTLYMEASRIAVET